MSNPINDVAQWTRANVDAAAERVFKLGTLIATWLVVGNAAAIVLSFNAVTQGRVCDLMAFSEVIWSFVLAVAAAFLGATVNYFGALLGVQTMGIFASSASTVAINQYLIEKLSAEGIEVAEDAPLNADMAKASLLMKQTQEHIWRHWALLILSVLFFAASATLFARGVLLPLSPRLASSLCVAA